MDNDNNPSRDSLALARKHVRALTDGGVSREALLRALLEQEEASNQLPPLPSQAASHPQLKKSKSQSKSLSLSRTQSLAQQKTQSHWSVSTTGTCVPRSHLLRIVLNRPVFLEQHKLNLLRSRTCRG